jgi:formylmethanofuran dehydrogenase subunit E
MTRIPNLPRVFYIFSFFTIYLIYICSDQEHMKRCNNCDEIIPEDKDYVVRENKWICVECYRDYFL